MPKRKRTEGSPSPASSLPPDPIEVALKSQKRTCNRRILDAKKSLVAALRLGAGFERQKHSRRKKTAQAKGDAKAIARLDEEYVVLKGLELEKVADQLLRKTLGRVKSLKEHYVLKYYVEGVEKGSTEPATLNVLARLYKVAAVKKVVDDAVDDLKGMVAASNSTTTTLDSALEKTGKRKKAEATKDEDEDMLDVSDEEGDRYAAFSARIAAPSSGEDDSEGSISDDERPPSVRDSEDEHDPDDDLDAQSESREADSFQGSSGKEDASSDGEDMAIDRRIAPPSGMSESESEASSSDKVAITTAKTKARTRVEAKPTSSAFIPSLSQATYVAGSDSDASDLDAEFAPRKNRRGQRARQKIAEAKFGAKAKHLEKQDRNKGWDPKRGAVSNDSGKRGAAPRGFGPQQSGENAVPLGKKKGEGKKRDDKGELHPSWQAAKLAKEKKQIKIDVRAPAGQGKKVVFD